MEWVGHALSEACSQTDSLVFDRELRQFSGGKVTKRCSYPSGSSESLIQMVLTLRTLAENFELHFEFKGCDDWRLHWLCQVLRTAEEESAANASVCRQDSNCRLAQGNPLGPIATDWS